MRWIDAGWVWEQCNITHKYAICILAHCGLLRMSHASKQDSSTSDDIMSNAVKQFEFSIFIHSLSERLMIECTSDMIDGRRLNDAKCTEFKMKWRDLFGMNFLQLQKQVD